MIKSHIEQAIAGLEAEKEIQLNAVKNTVTQDKIVPYNTSMDLSRDKAITEKQEEYNKTVQALTEQLEKDKQEIIAAAEQKKTENANVVIAMETAAITKKYEKELTKLREQLNDIEE